MVDSGIARDDLPGCFVENRMSKPTAKTSQTKHKNSILNIMLVLKRDTTTTSVIEKVFLAFDK